MRKLFKNLLAFLLMINLTLCLFGQEPEKAERIVPFKIDESVGNVNKGLAKSDPMIIGPALYQQMNQLADYYALTTTYSNPTFEKFSGTTADDFIVPEGEVWDVKYIRFTMYTPFLLDSIVNYNVFFYNDNAGKPGTIFNQELGVANVYYETRVEHSSMYDVTIELTSVVNFNTAGKYWFSAAPVTNVVTPNAYNEPGFFAGFMLQQNTSSINSQAMIKNNGGYFSLIDWSSMSAYWLLQKGVDYGYKNLNFALFGLEKNHDLAIDRIISPETGAELTSSEELVVVIQNHGTTSVAGSAYQVKFRINNGDWSDPEDGTAVSSGAEIYYTLHETADLSKKGVYIVEVMLDYATDENQSDNTLSKMVENYGIIYPAIPDTRVVYETCEGTFTDHGGLDNVYVSYSDDTVVFIPGDEGHRIRLEFYETGMSGAYGFQFYNGTKIDGPQITPTEVFNGNEAIFVHEVEKLKIEGVNPEGAITIVIPGFDINSSSNNFLASVSCVKNENTDFKVTDIKTSKPYSWEGEQIELTAELLSRGLENGHAMVTFFANNTEIGTVSSTTLNFGETGTAKIKWTPDSSGTIEVKAIIPADDGINQSEKEFVLQHEIYPLGYLVEGFEGDQYPPEGWVSKMPGGSGKSVIWYNNKPNWEGNYSASVGGDTLVTPKLEILETDTLEFIYSAGFFGGTCDIIYAPTLQGPWKSAHSVSYGLPFATNYKATLKRAVGNHYLGFKASSSQIDFVRGAKYYIPTHDLVALDFTGPFDPKVGEEVSYNFKIRNMGSGELNASDYSVKLWKNIDGVITELAEIPGIGITLANYAHFEFKHTFTEVERGKVFATIEFSSDVEISNNTSKQLDLVVMASEKEYVYVGDKESDFSDRNPFMGYYASYDEVIYLKEQLNSRGEISGITIYYNSHQKINFKYKLFFGETELDNLDDAFISTRFMDEVYSGVFNVEVVNAGFKPYYIALDKPYLYSGEKNLIVAFYQYNDVVEFSSGINLKGTIANYSSQRSYGFQYADLGTDVGNPIEINKLNSYPQESYPNINFYFTDMDASLAGTVTDADATPLENAKLSLGGYANTVATNADGNYHFPVMPNGNVDITAELYGYYNLTKTGTFTSETETKVDFSLESLPTIEVSGQVIANDSLNPVAGVEVFMEGYGNEYYTVTGDDGKFVLDGVFGDKEYEIEFVHPKYVTYTKTFDVSFENYSLATITLDEVEQPAFNIIAVVNESNTVDITWQAPYSGTEQLMDPTMGTEITTYWYNEPDEDVQLGNVFKVTKPGTVTSIEFSNWAWQGAAEGELYLRFYTKDRQEFLKPVSFHMPDTNVDWLQIDVPDFTYTEDFYVMIHWNKVHQQTAAIAYHGHDDNVAYLIDGAGRWMLLTDLVGMNYSGAFSIRANVLEAGSKSSKALISYDIWRSGLKDYLGGVAWTKLNETEITGTGSQGSYTDNDFSNLDGGYYMYILRANYTKSSSDYSFSNTVEKDLFVSVGLNVTANNSENIDGARVTLANTNGEQINSYFAEVAGGKVSFDRVLKGDYSLTITKGRAYWEYFDEFAVVIDTSINAELQEYIFTPSRLSIEVDDKVAKQAVFSWGLGDEDTYINDDNSYEQALTIKADGDAELGNIFEVYESGQIISVDIMGLKDSGSNPNNEMGEVTLVAYNANKQEIGLSDPFAIQPDSLFNVPMSFVPYNGPFYLMVRWSSAETLNTHALAIDTDSDPGTNYYNDEELGFVALADWGYYGNFILRANVLVSGKKATLTAGSVQQNNSATTISERLVSNSATQGFVPKSDRAAKSFSIYLEDLNTPIATGVTGQMFTFTEAEHLLIEGLHTYKAGVQSVYVTGESVVIRKQFDYDRLVGVNQDMENQLSIYPNPANNAVVLDGAGLATIEIYNSLGKLVQQIDTYNNLTRIDVSNLRNGVYILKINLKGGSVTRNLIINR